jgi:hypothetical protein
MLESQITQTYARMAQVPMPPSQITIPAAPAARTAGRPAGRARAIAAPVLAACAVVAVGMLVLFPASHHRSPALGTGREPAAPAGFDVLRPYVRLGGLPADEHPGWMNGTPGWQWVNYGAARKAGGELVAYARGQCTVSGTALICPEAAGSQLAPRVQPLGRRVATVHGSAAYWNPHGLVSSESAKSTISVPSTGQMTSHNQRVRKVWAGLLTWQYARGAWAKVYAPTLPEALSVARGTRFGLAVAPVFRFGIRLTGLPEGTRVDYLLAGPSRRSDVEFGLSGGYPEVGYHVGTNACLPARDIAGKVSTETIGGYRVRVFRIDGQPPWSLCAPNARGLTITIDGGRRKAAVTALFSHVRVLGTDPGRWTTKPVG